MPEVSHINIPFAGQTITLRKGDWVRVSAHGEDNEIGPRGDKAQIDRIIAKEDLGLMRFDVVKERRHPNWGDLGGRVGSNRGLRLSYRDLTSWFDLGKRELQVKEDFIFKKKNLRGMGCKVIASFKNNEVFVEMSEDIGGGSCDGLGRKGHCVIIKESMLAPKIVTKKKTTNKRRRKR